MQDVLDLGDDVLATWLHQQHTHTGSARDGDGDRVVEGGELGFAFYGRMSTQEHQDHATSAGWQRAAADDLVAGRGRIVAEYFDIGYSRRRAWSDRPQAAALLAALADPARGFDAVVVGSTNGPLTAPNCSTWPRCSPITGCRCG